MEAPKEFIRFLQQTSELLKFGNLVLPSGSVTELPLQYILTNLTDYDELFVPGDCIAVTSDSTPMPPNFRGTVWVVDTKGIPPGYARLRYNKSSKSVQKKACTYGQYLEFERVLDNRWPTNGPANKSPIISLSQILKVYGKSSFGLEEFGLDIVHCVPCPTWPLEAMEWIHRERPSGWPTREIIGRIVAGGCHLVPKPHPSVALDSTVLRFSFSMAEKLLIRSMTPIQKYVYHILRLIKAKVGMKNTYFFKTLMLWACETKPLSFWEESSLERSIRELLCDMVEWLIDEYVPNYFIPNNNMHQRGTDWAVEISELVTFCENHISTLTSNVAMVKGDQKITLTVSRKLFMLAVSRNLIKMKLTKSLKYKAFSILSVEFSELFTTLKACQRLAELETKPRQDMSGILNGFEKATNNKDQQQVEMYWSLSETCEENLEGFFDEKRFKCIDGRNTFLCSTRDSEVPYEVQEAFGFIKIVLIDVLDKLLPRISYFVSQAHFSNFHYVFMRDYDAALKICEKARHNYSRMQMTMAVAEGYTECCSVVLSTDWMSIHDPYIQTVFGFLLLWKKFTYKFNIYKTNRTSLIFVDLNKIFLAVSPITFIDYITVQCKILIEESCNSVHACNNISEDYSHVRQATRLVRETIRVLVKNKYRPSYGLPSPDASP